MVLTEKKTDSHSCTTDLLLWVEDALRGKVLEEADQELPHGLDVLRGEVGLVHEVQVEYVWAGVENVRVHQMQTRQHLEHDS